MDTVEWKPELSTGIKEVDEDHKRLIELSNRLISAIDNEIPQKEILYIFEELEDYTHYHFEREEHFMDTHCVSEDLYGMVAKHKSQHRYFIKQLADLKSRLQGNASKSVSYEIVGFLLHWLIDHIINEDLKLTQCLTHNTNPNKRSLLQRITTALKGKTSLHQRLWFILSIPLVFLIAQTIFISYNAYKKYDNLKEVQHITQAVVNIDNVITQLQKERGLSSAYIVSGYTHFKKALDVQRQKTDEVIQQSIKTKKVIEPYIDLHRGISALHQLNATRKAIDTKEMGREESVAYYTGFIHTLIRIIKHISYLPFNSIDQNTYSPLLLLMSINEIQGLIRNEGVVCISEHSSLCKRLRQLLQKKKHYRDAFELLAPPQLFHSILEIEHAPSTQKVIHMLGEIFQQTLHGTDDVQRWFDTATYQIERYKLVIENELKQIDKNAYFQKQHFLSLILTTWAVFALILLIVSISLYLLKESIIHPLESLTQALHNLSSGDKSVQFTKVNKRDAIGRMEHAYNHLRRSLIKADYAGILMELQKKKTQKYEKLAEEDPLTGIYNRRAFMHSCKYAVDQAHQRGQPLSLMILDLDHFKQVNDTYGHDIGDQLLIHFTQHTKSHIRSSDHFARIGGEEFALLLPDTPIEGARTLAQKIVNSIAALDLNGLAPGLRMTVSIGITQLKPDMDLHQLLKEADANLYKAKHTGRNRVFG
jgi:diguanylate cyclase (GGDEF)-like protein/hemerythrin-like metal-binding protein